MKPLDLSKPVQTRDGNPVRILCTDAKSEFPIVGLVNVQGMDATASWTMDGNFSVKTAVCRHEWDIVNVPQKHKRGVWLNIYPWKEWGHCFASKSKADECASELRIACVRVEIEFEEGQGLTPAP